MDSRLGTGKNGTEEHDGARPRQGIRPTDEGRRGLSRRYLWDALALSGNPPRIDALGVAIGLLVALGIPIGGHTLTLALLRPFIRYNVGLAFAVTWIINPLTVIPLYTAYYYVGSLVLGEPQTLGIEKFREALESIVHARHFWESLKAFLLLDLDVLERWAVTATTVSVLAAAVGYGITYRIQARRIHDSRTHS